MFRVLNLSDDCGRLSVHDRQIVVYGTDDPQRAIHRSPAEDLLAIILDGRRTHLTTSTLRALVGHGAAVLVSDDRHMPAGLLIPLSGYSESARRIRLQAAQTLPSRKRAWRDIVVAKIEAQASNLLDGSDERRQIRALAATVRSGDSDNREAQAARVYWPAFWADREYRRGDDFDPRNALLNYGYSIIRAAVARTITAVGLHGVFGVSHHARENAFALADDLMEPLRPFADIVARELWRDGSTSLGKEERQALISVVHAPCAVNDDLMPLWMGIQRLGQAYAGVIESRRRDLAIPVAVAAGT